MNAVATTFSSPRFQRYLLWFGVAVFAVGAAVLAIKLIGGSDKTSTKPDRGFHAVLPKNGAQLKNGDGVAIKTFSQLDPQIRGAIQTFISTAVARQHLADSWAVVAPKLKQGYTRTQWVSGADLPVVPYPGVDTKHVQYYLDYAFTNEILVEVGLAPKPGVDTRPVTFQLGLEPVSNGSQKKWLVDYWMPRWTPPVPAGN